MIFKNTLKLTSFLLAVYLLAGCDGLFEEHASQFHLDDINQVEWARPNPNSSSLSYTEDLEAGQTEPELVELTVQLIGAQTGSDRTAGVAVSETDATEGVHFELVDSEVIIQANSNFGTVQVRVLADNIADGESYFVILELQEGPELDVAVNFKDMILEIEKDS